MKNAKVHVRLRQEMTPPYVHRFKPHVVIVPTGAIPWIPDLPGIQSPRVLKAWDILGGKKKVEDSAALAARNKPGLINSPALLGVLMDGRAGTHFVGKI